MSSEQEFEGPSESEALEKAARVLGVTVSDLDYTLLDEGAEAVFGLGARPAKIRVAIRGEVPAEEPEGTNEELEAEAPAEPARERWSGPAPEKAARAREVSEKLLEYMGINGAVEVRDEDEVIVVELSDKEGKDEVEWVFTNARPPLGPSFQFLLNKMVNRFPEDRKHILLRSPGRMSHRSNRGSDNRNEEFDPELVAVAKLLWERALKTGQVITVHPMVAADRRAIHQTIMGLDDVKTVSAGEGIYRRMYVVASAAEAKRRRKKNVRRG